MKTADKDSPEKLIHNRRTMLKWAMLGGGGTVAGMFSGPLAHATLTPREEQAQAAVEKSTRGMPAPTIKDISVIDLGAGGISDCTVVKVTTNEPGLYGYGCATISLPGGRSKLVRTMVEQYLKPMLVGRETDRIEQIWQLCYQSSYYKNDNVQNAGIGGVCDALWDIKGRQAGMPVYQLAGGKFRDAAEIYLHVGMGPAS
jgi:mannonate dehydratase